MKVIITGRKMELSENTKVQTEKKLLKLAKFFDDGN